MGSHLSPVSCISSNHMVDKVFKIWSQMWSEVYLCFSRRLTFMVIWGLLIISLMTLKKKLGAQEFWLDVWYFLFIYVCIYHFCDDMKAKLSKANFSQRRQIKRLLSVVHIFSIEFKVELCKSHFRSLFWTFWIWLKWYSKLCYIVASSTLAVCLMDLGSLVTRAFVSSLSYACFF